MSRNSHNNMEAAVPTSVMDSSPQTQEHQAAGQETATTTELDNEASQCTYFQAQDGACCSPEEDQKCAENVSIPPSNSPHAEDHKSHKEGTEHKDPSTSKKGEGVRMPENPYHECQDHSADNKRDAHKKMPACCTALGLKPDEEAICQKEPEITPSEGQSSKVLDDLAEKKLEVYLVEETVQLDGKPKEVSESGVGEGSAGAEASSISEDHHANEGSIATPQNHQENKDDTLEASKDISGYVEVVQRPECQNTQIPLITVESSSTNQLDNVAESSESDTKGMPDCQKEHDGSLHHALGGAKDGAEGMSEGTEQGPTRATQEDPMTAAEEPEDAKISEDQGSADTTGTQIKACSGCHEDQLTQGAQEEKGALEM